MICLPPTTCGFIVVGGWVVMLVEVVVGRVLPKSQIFFHPDFLHFLYVDK